MALISREKRIINKTLDKEMKNNRFIRTNNTDTIQPSNLGYFNQLGKLITPGYEEMWWYLLDLIQEIDKKIARNATTRSRNKANYNFGTPRNRDYRY